MHARKLKEGDPEENKKCLALIMLTSNKLQHSTTEIGIFLGGFNQACKTIISYLEKKRDLPNAEYIKKLWEKGFEEYMPPHCDNLFNLYEDWKRKTEIEQFDNARFFSLFEASFNQIYKDYQRKKKL